jgi:hypothetical protein
MKVKFQINVRLASVVVETLAIFVSTNTTGHTQTSKGNVHSCECHYGISWKGRAPLILNLSITWGECQLHAMAPLLPW